jgi:hypothetical protein
MYSMLLPVRFAVEAVMHCQSEPQSTPTRKRRYSSGEDNALQLCKIRRLIPADVDFHEVISITSDEEVIGITSDEEVISLTSDEEIVSE